MAGLAVPAPQAHASGLLAPVPGRSHLPPAVMDRAPRRGDAAKQPPLRVRPGADVPPLAWESGVVLPAPWLAASGPPAYAPSPDAAWLISPWRAMGPDADRATASSDPTWHPSYRALLATVPTLRHKPAPFLRLAIPEPFDSATALRPDQQPADDDFLGRARE